MSAAGRRTRHAGPRRLLPRLALGALSLGVALGAGELVFRLLRQDSSAYSVAPTNNQYHFYRFDPVLGWANAPGAHGTFARDEFRYEVAVNAHGMRQGEVAPRKPAGVRRIAFVGDSFLWGIGVPDAERTTEQLAQRLRNVEVLNFGVSGYGPVQHLLNLDAVLDFAPDLVVVLFCLGNDFVDNVQFVRYGYYKPYAELDAAGALRIAGHPLPNTKAFGFEARPTWLGSELLGALRNTIGGQPAAAGQRGLALLDEAAMYAAAPDDDVAAQRAVAFAVNRTLFGAIAARVAGRGTQLLVVPAPTKFEYNRGGQTGHEGVFPQLEQALQQDCAALGIPFVPTVARLHGDDFWQKDGHWRPEGHRKIAAAIAEHLAGKGYELAR